jgi:hypothetical protein
MVVEESSWSLYWHGRSWISHKRIRYMGMPRIVENYDPSIARIVKRIFKYAPESSIEGLEQVSILNNDYQRRGFACYSKDEKEIRLFSKELVDWQPWILKKTYLFPYITVGLALGHEIDHHVNRENNEIDKEKTVGSNAIKYIYPSFGMHH